MAEDAGKSSGTAPRVDLSEFPATTYSEWKDAATAALKGAVFEKSMYTKTYEGITLDPLYTLDSVKDLGAGQAFPAGGTMMRGTSASEYIGKPWEIAQPASGYEPSAVNAVIKEEMARGATAATFNVCGCCDCGVSVSTTDDARALFDGIDLKKHGVHAFCGESALPFLALAEAAGIGDLSGCIGADPIGATAAGHATRGANELFDEAAASVKLAERHAPKLRTLLLRGAFYHNAGAHAAQEVACVMANAVCLARELGKRGVGFDEFARRLRFEFSIGANFFMEIAKIRAARVVWERIAEAFEGSAESRRANIFARTSSFTKTVYDPYVNMLRNTEEAFAAVVGGVDGMTVVSFDEPVRPADEFSRRVSRNAQIMLQNEFHFTQPADPAGGSWYIEALTHELAGKIWAEFQKIEGEGGILKALEAGAIQKEIAAVLDERFKNLAARRDRAVGTNMYANTTEQPLDPRPRDTEALKKARAAAVDKFKAARDGGKADASLAKLASAGADALSDAAIEAAKSGATAEEIAAKLHKGDPAKVSPLTKHRWTEQFEEMRTRTEKFRDEHGENVKVFLANMGPIPQHKARADFITGFMEVANFEVLKNDGFKTPEECAAAAEKSGADIAVICSTDKAYPETVPPVAKLIKEKCPKMKICLAGAPAEEFKQSYIDAGVSDFIHVRTNCLEFLTELQKDKGMR